MNWLMKKILNSLEKNLNTPPKNKNTFKNLFDWSLKRWVSLNSFLGQNTDWKAPVYLLDQKFQISPPQ